MSHGHHHAPEVYDRAFKFGIAMNAVYVVIEAGCGIAFDSMALLSDAGHNLGDVLALVLAWGASWISRAALPTTRRTYGMKRATVLASLASAVMLCLALGVIIWESVARLNSPVATGGLVIVLVAGIGMIINTVTALMFMAGRHADLNLKSAFLHMSADAAVSAGVVMAGLVIYLTGWLWVDPVVALLVAVLILVSGFALLRESLDLSMDAVPRHVETEQVQAYLDALPGVVDAHHLHIWGVSTTETALTVHLVIDPGISGDRLLSTIAATLNERFSIQHPTIQIEQCAEGEDCVYEREAQREVTE